mmetsp:Transcript_21025/g.43840  ORF Transcript_21025/g.43840 Transcript_21025/m.43840 type:complete len:210 (+) Transcript_21025:458-1087(+)
MRPIAALIANCWFATTPISLIRTRTPKSNTRSPPALGQPNRIARSVLHLKVGMIAILEIIRVAPWCVYLAGHEIGPVAILIVHVEQSASGTIVYGAKDLTISAMVILGAAVVGTYSRISRGAVRGRRFRGQTAGDNRLGSGFVGYHRHGSGLGCWCRYWHACGWTGSYHRRRRGRRSMWSGWTICGRFRGRGRGSLFCRRLRWRGSCRS